MRGRVTAETRTRRSTRLDVLEEELGKQTAHPHPLAVLPGVVVLDVLPFHLLEPQIEVLVKDSLHRAFFRSPAFGLSRYPLANLLDRNVPNVDGVNAVANSFNDLGVPIERDGRRPWLLSEQ